MMANAPAVYVSRKAEILVRFKQVLESHLNDFMAGREDKIYELKEIADIICLHPVHLSKVIELETGHHACYFYVQIQVREILLLRFEMYGSQRDGE